MRDVRAQSVDEVVIRDVDAGEGEMDSWLQDVDADGAAERGEAEGFDYFAVGRVGVSGRAGVGVEGGGKVGKGSGEWRDETYGSGSCVKRGIVSCTSTIDGTSIFIGIVGGTAKLVTEPQTRSACKMMKW